MGLLDDRRWEKCLFDGSWRPAASSEPQLEPATGAVLAEIGQANVEDVARAAATAEAAQVSWANSEPKTRAAVLRRAAELMKDHYDELATWVVRETGAVPAKAETELLGFSVPDLEEAAGLAMLVSTETLAAPDGLRSTARRVPRGVIGVISPFNFPVILGLRSVAPALALGNAVVLKPGPQTQVTGGILFARLFEEAGLPAGVLQVLMGGPEVGEAIVTDPKIQTISFTGSTATGRRINELAAPLLKKVTLELGGNNPFVVTQDADLDLASSAGAWATFLHQGQICMTAGRHIVHEDVAEEYARLLIERAERLPVGDPFTEQVALGPLISQQQADRVTQIVDDSVAAGATVRTGGTPEGQYYPATVLTDVTRDMPVYTEEVFGPVAAIITYSTDEEAIELANDTVYGLSAAVHAGSEDRGWSIAQHLRAGMVHVNDQTVNYASNAPIGGYGCSGNGGALGGAASVEEFTQWQWVTARERGTAYPF